MTLAYLYVTCSEPRTYTRCCSESLSGNFRLCSLAPLYPHTHKHVAISARMHNPNSVQPNASTVNDWRHLDTVVYPWQLPPLRVMYMRPAANPQSTVVIINQMTELATLASSWTFPSTIHARYAAENKIVQDELNKIMINKEWYRSVGHVPLSLPIVTK